MKRLLTLLALVLCSCAETFVGEEIARPNNANLPDLTASFAEEEVTRTYIEEGKYLRWNEDDRLTIFFGNTLNRQYKFNGKTGDNSGTFSLVPDGMLGTGNTLDAIYAIYPYDENASITDSGVISLTLPATQSYAENSFGRGANTMLAVTENVEDTFLSFKNTCGYLKLKLYNAEGASIKSIEVKGNSGERLAGAATATIAFGETPVLVMADDATTSVTLDCGEGVALGTTAETATEFWVVLPATTFAEGLTINATDAEGKVFKKSTTKEVVIERNAIQPMAVLEAKFVATKPANNEIWYTNGSTTEATKYNVSNPYYIRITSNTYNAEMQCWVIKFSKDVTKIDDSAFRNCSSLTSVTIPDSVTEIGYYAFQHCSSLTSVTIPNSVTTIGNKAFEGCTGKLFVNCNIPSASSSLYGAFYRSKFTSVTIGDIVTTIGDYAFYECNSLTSITIPDSVTSIGFQAFRYCKSLTSVTIGKGVTTIGGSAFQSCSSLTSVTIGASVTTIGDAAFDYCTSLASVTIPDSVTSIGNWTFSDCTSLASVTIGDGVTSIGKGAFADCWSLTSVTIGNGVTSIGESAFEDCGNLESITIPDSVTSIGEDAFADCSSLTSVVIGDSVTTIGRYAFSYCKSLTSIIIPDSVTTIGTCVFEYCNSLESVTIGDSVTEIATSAFYNCENLTSVAIGDGVTKILNSAFEGCSSLISIRIPDSVTEIFGSAFLDCDSLQEFKGKYASEDGRCLIFDGVLNSFAQAGLTEYAIPDSVTEIGYYAFCNCSGLTSISIPNSVTTIGDYAFKNCSGLTSITIPEGVTSIGRNAFEGCTGELFVYNIPSASQPEYGAFYRSEFTSIIIGDSIATIGDCAFYECNCLTSITIPDSVTEIGDYAFCNCSGLTSITIPDSVTEIGYEAFCNCDSLTSVTIGNGVTAIGALAFADCRTLTSVYSMATTPPSLGYDVFWAPHADLNIYVPMALVEVYKSASGWSDYASYIVGYDFGGDEGSGSGNDSSTDIGYTVTLNNAWRQSTSVSNPDSSLYDGVYESYSNYNKDNGAAMMYIDIEGYNEFCFYIRSDAESTYDYVTVSELDSTTQKVSTSGTQNSGTAISSYTKVTYTGIDGGSHRIIVTYRKDGSVNYGSDRGYVLIPKNQ